MGGPRSAQGFCVVVLNVVEQLVAAGGSSPLPAPRCDGVLRWVRAGLWLWPWLPCVKQNQLLYLKQKGKTTEKTRLLFWLEAESTKLVSGGARWGQWPWRGSSWPPAARSGWWFCGADTLQRDFLHPGGNRGLGGKSQCWLREGSHPAKPHKPTEGREVAGATSGGGSARGSRAGPGRQHQHATEFGCEQHFLGASLKFSLL